jgi:hypothetical protein
MDGARGASREQFVLARFVARAQVFRHGRYGYL